MRYVALATDFDGTLACGGCVERSTIDALKRLAATGRRLLLVTGRELDDLSSVFAETELFDRLVVENGAVLHRPSTGETRVLAAAPPPQFVAELARRGVAPLSAGASIVATWHPNERTVLDVIRELGLELQVTFNKGAVMVLPAGVNKASGARRSTRGTGALRAQRGRDRRCRKRSCIPRDGRVLRSCRQRRANAKGEGRHRYAR